MNTWRNASLAVTAAAVLALTTACGQETGTTTPAGQAVGAAKPAGQPAAGGYGADYSGAGEAASAPKTAGQLAVLDSKKLGKVLTDSEGWTLYRFDKDTVSPPKSNCEGDCAKAWPVVAAGDVTAAPGTDASLIGEVTRADGSKQLTIGGWPMYRYAKDTKPGDTKGQGVGGTWFASAPDGKKAAAGGAGDGAEEAGGEAADLAGLSVRKDPKLGDVVVDKNGMTVYRFMKDSAWPMKTACTGACLEKWPVVEPVAKNDTEGILKKGFVTFDRPDGIKQQTIDCWPIYTYSGDSKPGDTNGQGVGGTWYAVSPQGKPVGAPK
ncbi:SCO0930 family lipoprotein [Streptomyces sp. NPDC057445]|uniref:SCO0930 family lipoprotein n=1 Tax=Streptomyces sp. NPDC057445 TaxID=3346136 RepID=UPI0036A7F4EF